MPGGLMQLTNTGAQNHLLNGNPSMTHFRAVYRRHTNFAMESVRMSFSSANLDFNATQSRTLTCRIDRYAQLLHDTYLVLTLPDIWSPLYSIGSSPPPAGYDPRCTAIGYEFQWIKNIGYNLIDRVELVANGVVIQSLKGEWLKLYSHMTHDAAKRAIVDRMTGNLPELYDPANAFDRIGQYPHAVTPQTLPTTMPYTTQPEPSIRSQQLVIPLHFWFSENPGLALPLVSMQNSETSINVVLRPLNQLYTIVDVNPGITTVSLTSAASSGTYITFTTSTPHKFTAGNSVTISGVSALLNGTYIIVSVPAVTSNTFAVVSTQSYSTATPVGSTATSGTNPTFGQRIQPTGSYPIGLFLSPPTPSGTSSNPLLTSFFADPYLEGNFIYLTDMEMNQLATADQIFLIKQLRYVVNEGQFGANTDIEIPMFNMVTRVVFTAQRSDSLLINDWDNYTNWTNPKRAPFSASTDSIGDMLYSSGQYQISSVYPRDPMVDGQILFDGNERFKVKPASYFSLLQQYKHTTGTQPETLPGVHIYSFALNHDQYQPSGAMNGSVFNKAILRVSLQQPLPSAAAASAQSVVCILKETVFNQNPVVIQPADLLQQPDGSYLYTQDQVLTVVRSTVGGSVIFSYTYNVGVYVESINYLRIVSGLANLVFAN
jgi:hypothetical protein